MRHKRNVTVSCDERPVIESVWKCGHSVGERGKEREFYVTDK